MPNIHTIATHEKPHLDEIAAIWLLRKFGEKRFPGISTAGVAYWDSGGTPDGRAADAYEKEGILPVGVGGGSLDEHPAEGRERREGECAATLTADLLGIRDDPVLEKILKFVLMSDTKGAGNSFDLAYLVKAFHRQYPEDSKRVMEWVLLALEVKYNEQVEFLSSAREEFQKAEVEEVPGPNGQTLKMATVRSDSELVGKFARSERGCRAAVVIQRLSRGNTQIYTNKLFRVLLYDVAQMIRLAEQEAKGEVVTTDWRLLASEGKVKGAEEWYFHSAGQFLLNGSLTTRNVPPTRLSLESIQEIVRIGVNPNAFEPKRAEDCTHGICTSTRNNPCPWYAWGLHRCRKIRYEMLHAHE